MEVNDIDLAYVPTAGARTTNRSTASKGSHKGWDAFSRDVGKHTRIGNGFPQSNLSLIRKALVFSLVHHGLEQTLLHLPARTHHRSPALA